MSDPGFAWANILSDRSFIKASVCVTVSIHQETQALCKRAQQTAAAHPYKNLQGRHGIGCPGVVISCCPSVLECRDAVVCSGVPAFRYESALGPAEQEMAEHGRSAHCP